VVPVRNGGRNFERCLQRLRESRVSDFELIVVDDGSTDDSAALALHAGATVVRNPTPCGPAAARNLGAQATTARWIFFLDADVAVHPDTLGLALARFEADPDLTALFGSYDDQPAAPGLVSQYRNLLHHFVHQRGSFHQGIRPAHTFWTGCGMIRRDVFLQFGGFDRRLYPRPAIEDIELGYRLTRAGHRIVLARDVQATHFKRWTLHEMVRTDIFRRGVPWTLLIKRSGTSETDLNVTAGQKACVALTGLTLLAALLGWAHPLAGIGLVFGLAAIVAINHDFFAFLARRRGTAFAIAALPLQLIYYCCCGFAVLIAQLHWHTRIRRGAASIRLSSQERSDPATGPIPAPAGARRRRRRPRWPLRSR
jgi:hypothetical protein